MFLLLPLLLANTFSNFAQTNTETFGQNRVQHRFFDWRFFETEHFRIYHYDASGRQLARYVAEQAEKDIRIVEQKMGGQFPRQFNIILYNNYDDYRQTNVGRRYDSQLQDVPAGTVDLVGDKLVVYFTGVHTDVRKQLRSGMSRVVMQRMIFGESFREMVKNAVVLNLPVWATDGYIAYLVDGWDTETENRWKNLLAQNPGRPFFDLAEKDPEIAGRAFWKYVSCSHGENNVRNLLYSMQMKGSLPQGIRLTLGRTMKQTNDSLLAYYKRVYELDAARQETPDTTQTILEIPAPMPPVIIKDVRVSPKGRDVAYIQWINGEYKVIIQHTYGPKEKNVILEGGLLDYNERMIDPDYPRLVWSNNGYKLAILYKKGTKTRLRIYNALKAKIENYVIPPNRFDRVLGMTFLDDDQQIIFSAIKKSQTDLFLFTIRGARIVNITNDAWSDIQPTYVSGGSRRGILFLSNRPEPSLNAPIAVNELPVGPMNVFFYDTRTRRPELLQCSNVTTGNVSQPIQFGQDNFAFLYDSSGIRNKYVVLFARNRKNLDSAYAVPVTNYTHSILEHQYNPASNSETEVIEAGKTIRVLMKPLNIPDSAGNSIKTISTTTLSAINRRKPVTESGGNLQPGSAQTYLKPPVFLSSGNIYQSEFEDTIAISKAADQQTAPALPEMASLKMPDSDIDSFRVDSTYVKMRAQPYRLSLKPDFFTVRVDNNVLFNKYQPAAYNGNQFSQPNLGGMITVSLNDALEDYRLTGGFRLPVDLGGMTYFLQFENFRRKIDWSVLLLRTERLQGYNVEYRDRQNNRLINPQLGKVVTNLVQGSATYPFNRVQSIRGHLGVRQDVLNWKATDSLSLAVSPRERMYWVMSRFEYVYDNTTSPTLNIRRGLRYKFYGEYLYQLSKAGGGMYNLGFDARHYLRLYKNITLASRGAFAHSGGPMRINYMMGGVDNWILAKQANVPPAQNYDFAFQSLVTNMRGYLQNSRNGNTYGVINAEIRVPIFQTFLKRPIQSAFLRHLQLVPFVDIGSAWNGLLPTVDNMATPYTFINPQNGLAVYTSLPQQDLLLGYGAGVRTMLFGYFMRLDAAWNVADRTTKPLLHFSIGTDF